MQFDNLDTTTRKLMIEELDRDIAARTLYHSPRLTAVGWRDYPQLLREALADGTPETLAAALREPGRMKSEETRWTPKNRITIAHTPYNAAVVLAEDQFNRYYVRAVCRRAIENGTGTVEVYRARPAAQPRASSLALEGRQLSAQVILDDVRDHTGEQVPRFRVPGGIHSGISVRLPARRAASQ